MTDGFGLGVVLSIALLISMQAHNVSDGERLVLEAREFVAGTDWKGKPIREIEE